ncbi:MAG: PIN/TRAM domain-containing protein, partial [Planctomycetes bacterium]|nr:PIN/TRAM domain-containing protein [Planctomycetota bacterium]
IADIAATGVLATDLIVPRFILQELQTIADSSDKLKRTRGRRGLDMLNKLQSNEGIDIRILEVKPERSAPDAGADDMLVDLAMQLAGKLVTNDYNLNKVAQLRGVSVININDLANALKPVVLPGESLSVKMIKPGEEAGQGIGYLEDGTMVVAEGGRERVGEQVALTVTSVLQTSAGRMIFGRVDGIAATDRRRT